MLPIDTQLRGSSAEELASLRRSLALGDRVRGYSRRSFAQKRRFKMTVPTGIELVRIATNGTLKCREREPVLEVLFHHFPNCTHNQLGLVELNPVSALSGYYQLRLG